MIAEILYSIHPLIPDVLLVGLGLGLFTGAVVFTTLPGDLKKYIVNYCLTLPKRHKKVLVLDLISGRDLEGDLYGETVEIKDNNMKKVLVLSSKGLKYKWGRPFLVTFALQGVCEKPEFFAEMQKLVKAVGKEAVVDFMRAVNLVKNLKKKKFKTKKDLQMLEECEEFIENFKKKIGGIVQEQQIKIDANEFLEWCEKGEFPCTMRVYMPIDYDVITSAAWGVNGFAIAQITDALAEVKKRKMKLDAKELGYLLIVGAIAVGLVYIFLNSGSIDYEQLAQAISTAMSNATTSPTQPPAQPPVIGP